jgi:hypothetical protein
MVLKTPTETVVQIGSMDALKAAKPGESTPLVSLGDNGNGHADGNGNGAEKKEEAPLAEQAVAGD